MARTWPVTRRKRVLLSAFDAVARPFASLLHRDRVDAGNRDVKRILVLELWHMGDVVLATPVLQRLREIYPAATITLLAKAHAAELLEGSGLVDDIVTYDFPWTATSAKYNPARYDGRAISELVKDLRAKRFDLSLDCRMDLRSNVLTRSIGARRRIGYDFGGGGFLLTDALPPPPAEQHKVDDWMALLEPLKQDHRIPGVPTPEPHLSVSAVEREEARQLLESYGIAPDDLVVGIHPGGSHDTKRWSADNFAEVARSLASRHDARLVAFVDPEGFGADMQLGGDAVFVRTSIREMMGLFTFCDLVLCNDSGPMHAAAALGIPVVAVFRTGSPAAYGPRGVNHAVVGRGAHWGETSTVPLEDVMTAADSSLSLIRERRHARAEHGT
ncbi:MAG: glycosyltransferase family 9 protein [Gemmatimonadales bacterium]